MERHWAATAAALWALTTSAVTMAQESYPARAITLVVPFAPGSGTDIAARSLARSMGETLGATVVVDNKPGANGAIGAQGAARAKADGYTLLVGSGTTNAANFAFFPGKLGYEPSSFDIIGGLMGAPLALHVPAQSPWKTVGDLVAAKRSRETALSCGSGNAVTQVACEIFKRQTKVDAVTVPYKSNPQSLSDVVGGQVSYAFSDTAASQVFVQGKQLRIIGIAGPQRNPTVPDSPTFAEQGFPDFQFMAWTGLFAPAGTPAAVLHQLNGAVRKWLDSPEAVDLQTRSGSVALRFDIDEARRFSQGEITRWAAYIKESNVRPEQ